MLFAVVPETVRPLALTVWVRVGLVLASKVAVAVYTVVRECDPAARVLMVNEATPELRVAVPNSVEPSLKVTVPVATPRLATTVVVRVILVP